MEVLNKIKNFIVNNDIENAYKTIIENEKKYKDNSIYWNLRGMMCFKINEYDIAIDCYKKAIDIEYDNIDAYFNLAYIYKLLNQNLESLLYANVSLRYTDDNEIINEIKSIYSSDGQPYKINIFFYGNDNFGLINDDLLISEVYHIRDEKELNILSENKKNPSNKNIYNILLVEKDIILNNNFFDKVLNYSKILDLFLRESLNNIYLKYYDLHYLKKSLESSYEDSVYRIVVGNSYSLIGIEEQLLKEKTINLSMHSQDLYYSYKLAKEVILKNKNIKQCIFCMSLFTLHQDLSKGESLYSQNMIKNVYYPLLNDIHNSSLAYIEKQKTLKECKLDIYMNIFDIDKVEEYIRKVVYSKITSYYSSIYNLNRQTSLNDFDMAYKVQLGLDRANGHNKMFKYDETEVEYRQMLKEFLDFLEKNDVQPIIVVFPASKYYLKNIKVDYIQNFNDLLKQIVEEYNIKVIDLRDSFFEFDDGDFIDADHLNEKGAIKATNYLKQFI